MRLDSLITRRGLLKSREAAKAAIQNGNVFVDGKCIKKPSADFPESADIEIYGFANKYVGRGGYKLERALDYFCVDINGRVCLDIGASTGGFTDCLLQRGAALVYAVDVGHGQLVQTLQNDSRVVSLEGINARDLKPDMLEQIPEFATVDVSFISLSLVLPVLRKVLPENGEAICLIKPQFEAGRGNVGKNGVVRDEKVHVSVLQDFIENTARNGFAIRGITHSPVPGGKGNIEFLAYLSGEGDNRVDVHDIVKSAHINLL